MNVRIVTIENNHFLPLYVPNKKLLSTTLLSLKNSIEIRTQKVEMFTYFRNKICFILCQSAVIQLLHVNSNSTNRLLHFSMDSLFSMPSLLIG